MRMNQFGDRLKTSMKFGPVGKPVLIVLFILSAAIAAFSTYMSVSETGRTAAGGSSVLMWMLLGNLALILVLGASLLVPIWRLYQENRQTSGSARLRLRIIALFGLAAMLPTFVVAGFLGVLINRSVEIWFSDKVRSAVESASKVAEASQRAIVDDLLFDLNEAALDLNEPEYVEVYTSDPNTFWVSLGTMAKFRNLTTLYILNGDREVQMKVQTEENGPEYVPHTETNWIAARNGRPAVYVSEDFVVSAILRLQAYDDLYIYAARQGPQSVADQLRATSDGLTAYREADARKNELRAVFTLSYVEAALLVLLMTAWLGMSAARRIASPIGTLAGAARAVRDGDLSVRLERPVIHDEIDDLTEAFNQMTMRLSRQTRDLERARVDAETRSLFIEAVLESVEAGVIRVDPAFNVTIANASASRLLNVELDKLNASTIADVAPEFLPTLRFALETGSTQGANIKRSTDDGVREIHARIAPEIDNAGCVITFHDTTRLAVGQRQAAWKDVARRIAHEIRNPLTPIQLSTERIRRRFGDQITTDREIFDKCIATILRQVGDIGRMVEEFSSFARMPKPVFSTFDVCELVRNVAFARKLAAPGIKVSVQVPDGYLKALGDDRLLGQALTNVIKNACEAVERHVEAGEIKEGSVTVTLASDDDRARITISDTGPGFPKEGRDRLLEPYVTTRESGVGLGLAIVNRIIVDHGGSIGLGDNEGGGARVDITLPLVPDNNDNGAEHADAGVV
ncbi:MAG: PAS domain-containing sensor histidine kinase [Hirschia sp.]|mgnify:CR=1 FL=1|nr:PAS domain-containing sensor histidine kinase [Hirschia sp.]MBF17993.1 PAS domain-containing sensor histidine kinase [Hirschia sp.]